MATLGNHLKITVHPDHREKIRQFYTDLLRCEMLTNPNPNLDIFHFSIDNFYGIYYSTDALSEKEMLKATWLEIKSDNFNQLEQDLLKTGVTEIDYTDKNHFYFQSPGGQVYRLAADKE